MGVGDRPEQDVAAGGNVKGSVAQEERGGHPGGFGCANRGGEAGKDAEVEGAGGVGGDVATCVERAFAALDVVDTATDVASGEDGEVAATEFDQFGGVGAAGRGAGVGRDRGVHVGNVATREEGDISAAESAHILEEIGEIHPPGGGGGRVG